MLTTRSLLLLSAAVESATGLAFLTLPRLIVHLLLGTDLCGSGVATSRVCGLALLCLGVACWPKTERDAPLGTPSGRHHPFRALFLYNALATAYLAYLRILGGYRGIALVPAIVFHAVVTILFLTRLPTSPRVSGATPRVPARP